MKPRTLATIGIAMGIVVLVAPAIWSSEQPLAWRVGKALLLITVSLPAFELGVRLGARLSTRMLNRLNLQLDERDTELTRKPITLLNLLVFILTAAIVAWGINWQLQGYTTLGRALLMIGTSTGFAMLLTGAITFARSLARAIEDDDIEAS